jgi:hypothetical protein
MKRIALAVLVVATPALVAAQDTTRARGGSAGVTGRANAAVSLEVPRSFSAEGRAKLEAMYANAKEKQLPPEPIAQRVAEGQAKGASEASILASANAVQGRLEATQRILVKAKREPRPEEISHGANAMERGVTEVQLTSMVEKTPSDRSLTVAFDVLTQLAAGGVPVTNALAQVQAKLDARAPDSAILSLTASLTGRGRGGH